MIVRCLLLLALYLFSFHLIAAERKSLVVEPNERVVHLVGIPFEHVYCEPRLETSLVEHYSEIGLTYRRIDPGPLSQLAAQLDDLVRNHRPTLVIIQCTNNDLADQYRSPQYDFSRFPQQLDAIVGRLNRQQIRVVICSVVPVDNGSASGKLLAPNDGLKTWVDAAREVAVRHDAYFVDLFTDTVGWPMIGSTPSRKYHYAPAEHERSFEMLRRQLNLPKPSESLLKSTAWQAELTKGHQVTREMNAIDAYRLPDWVKLPDFADQKRKALQSVRDDLVRHDRSLHEMAVGNRKLNQ